MVRSKQKPEETPEEQVDFEEIDGEDDDEDIEDYITRDQLKLELKNRINDVEGDSKIAFAALFQLYGKQEELDEEEDKEIEAIKHKYRLKTEDLINKTRKIVSGESTENALLSKSEILNKDEKTKQLNTISLPDFWSKVIKNSSFSALISKEEESAINSIKNVIVNYSPSTKEVSIEIHFGQNSVFTNHILKASLTEEPTNQIKHKYDTPKYKPHYVRPQTGFLNLFNELPQAQLLGLYEYWLNFYQEQIPHALSFYFELREGTFHAKIPDFMEGEYDEDEQDELDEQDDQDEEEQVATKDKSKSKKRKNNNTDKKGVEKPECKQQ